MIVNKGTIVFHSAYQLHSMKTWCHP